jgi:signal transduction histidine kinase
VKVRKNIKLRRAVVIILTFFTVFITTAVFVLFKTSVKHDSEHIRIVGLTGEIEREILWSRIWVDEIMLNSDDRHLENLHESIFLLRGLLYELNGFLDNEYARFSNGNLDGFIDEYDRILNAFSVLEAHIADDTTTSLIAANAMLIPLFDDFSTSYRKFSAILPNYLILDKQQFRNEMLGIGAFNTLIIILAGIAILKLTHRVVQADRNLIRNTVEVENRERERIAADLHDGLGSLLSGLMIHIQVLQKRNEDKNDFSLSTDLRNLQSMVNSALDGIEEVINNLSPSELLQHGLIDSVERLVIRINRIGQTTFRVELQDQPPELGHHKELLIFRICSELINNTLKHAEAKDAKIKFVVHNRMLIIEYQDNGKGFEYFPGSSNFGKDGLNNIVRRIESMEGSYTFGNSADDGMYVKISIPTRIT